ncbi:hypothetical protein K3555_16100 [Leisingera sp. M527]|uniref:hypothetical protein n=1 Tax=Leisingera sp. M527 TaxID=2867014 RepID=UPI0021A6CA47|nr:hypothetical protein [Leisingera sp. M527]UWQ32082.1 hypothetical protein K3555_16100 [Leisingera sp. M527]
MKFVKAQTSGWQFILEPEARWLAVECLLMAARFEKSFHQLYRGALADEIVVWHKKHRKTLDLVARTAYQGIVVSLDESRQDYLAARKEWPKAYSNELVPLGRALEFMVSGSPKQTAIQKAISSFRRSRAAINKVHAAGELDLPDVSGWPEGYRFLSVDSFRQRFKRFECVLPYAYIYYRNRDYNAWSDVIPEERNPVILPEDFEVWNAYFWGELTQSRRIRMRPSSHPLGINFQ